MQNESTTTDPPATKCGRCSNPDECDVCRMLRKNPEVMERARRIGVVWKARQIAGPQIDAQIETIKGRNLWAFPRRFRVTVDPGRKDGEA